MFNLFKKKKEQNPVSEMLKDLSNNQKMSVINLLFNVAVCDDDEGNEQKENEHKEQEYLNTFAQMLDIRADRCMLYLKSFGFERIIYDLSTLSKKQKEFLVLSAWEMINCDGSPNETEFQVTGAIFEKIGVSDEQVVAIIEKSQILMKHFFGI